MVDYLRVEDGFGTLSMTPPGSDVPYWCVIMEWTKVLLTSEGKPMAFRNEAAALDFLKSLRAMALLGEGTINIQTKELGELLKPAKPPVVPVKRTRGKK